MTTKHIKERDERFPLLTESQLANQTSFTKTGQRSMANEKPYRTPEQKKIARQRAIKVNGTHKSSAPKSYH